MPVAELTAPKAAPPIKLPDTNAPLSTADHALILKAREAYANTIGQLRRKIVGQEEILEQLLISFFSGGHTLLVGVPGLAKTLMVRSLAEVLNLGFNRIQFTPDLMPSDITGTEIIAVDPASHERGFHFRGGPIFNNIILADEINRTPPKTQAAMLEAMEEYTVHVGGVKYDLPRPFFVLATQNPIEQEGTYHLPAAALDRFMFNIFVDYPDEQTELTIAEVTTSRDEAALRVVLEKADILAILGLVRRIPIDDAALKYAIEVVHHTRRATPLAEVREYVSWGASPRATQALILGAKARAILHGRDRARPSDIRAVALPVLRHRIVCSFHAESEGFTPDEIVKHILKTVPRPKGDLTPEQEARMKREGLADRMTQWLWTPETRRELEARSRRVQSAELTRFERMLQRGNRVKPRESTIVVATALLWVGALIAAGSMIDLFTERGALAAAMNDDTRVIGGVLAGAVAAVMGLLAVATWSRWGISKTLGIPLLGLMALFALMAFLFTEGVPHEKFSVVHIGLLDLTTSASFTKGFDWAALVFFGCLIVPSVLLFLQRDEV